MASTASLGPFAGEAPALRNPDPRYDNQPPLDERVMMEFIEDLERDGVSGRISVLLGSAERVPETIEDEATAGKIGDLLRMGREVEKRVDEAREKHNRPILTAQRALKGKADAVLSPLQQALNVVRSKLNRYVAEQQAKVEAERRRAEEEAQRAREALEREDIAPEVIAQIVQPPRVEAPVARGDLGARVGARKVMRHEIVNVRQVPDRFLKHPKVVEALSSVVGQAVRSGEHNIKGVRIWEETAANVR